MTTSPLAKQAQETGITTVIFDMGAVLIDWDPRYLYRLAQVCSPQWKQWNLTMDGGRPVDQALAERQRLYPQHHDAIQAWKDRWPEMLAGSVPGSAALVRDLHQAGVPLYGLTNLLPRKPLVSRPTTSPRRRGCAVGSSPRACCRPRFAPRPQADGPAG